LVSNGVVFQGLEDDREPRVSESRLDAPTSSKYGELLQQLENLLTS
jgi:hypothetical protein